MSMRPAPRSRRAFDCCASKRTPVALAMRPATSRACARKATPDSISVVRLPERMAATAAAMCGCSTCARASGAVTALNGAWVSVQAASAGRISVAMRPGAVRA